MGLIAGVRKRYIMKRLLLLKKRKEFRLRVFTSPAGIGLKRSKNSKIQKNSATELPKKKDVKLRGRKKRISNDGRGSCN